MTSSRLSDELTQFGIQDAAAIYHNPPASVLIEHAIQRMEGRLAANGALVVRTGKFTGRSPKDKYIVEEPSSQSAIWWGSVNQPLSERGFDNLLQRVGDYLSGRSIYVQDVFGGADHRYRLPVRVVTEYAWHSLFAQTLLVRPDMIDTSLPSLFQNEPFTIIAAPGCRAVPNEDGTQSETFIAIHLGRRIVLIGGTEYAGEIKKSVFTLLNYLLPRSGIFSMHCSANIGREQGDSALFFGLSGTGKTTLSADPLRDLIGDDEHGWSDDGIFNFEGGCYAKCIRLSAEKEPQIWDAIRFGSVLENVVMDGESRELDYDSAELTENTRAAYPVNFIPNARIPGVGSHPKHIVFLTAVWLVNTGWTGGVFGVGRRMDIAHTRAMLHAALSGKLDAVEYRIDPTFGLHVPMTVPGVPSEVLDPRAAWADKAAYDAQAQELARLFVENFAKYRDFAAPDVIAAAPRIQSS
jgi:phosphoenolpyruvate carboxykinase (ATP)